VRLLPVVWLLATCSVIAVNLDAQFRVLPYLQNPAEDGMTVVWFSEHETPGNLTLFQSAESQGAEPSLAPIGQWPSAPAPALELAYVDVEAERFFPGHAPAPPFRHQVKISDLKAATKYRYQVHQGEVEFEGFFRTAPAPGTGRVRLVFFADSETEPESTGKHVNWTDPAGGLGKRQYLIDQTTGFANNLRTILSRQPDLIAISGDLVESGGEQQDWDEFWKHLSDVDGVNLAGRIPLLAAPGNHEYYEGPSPWGAYEQPGSERAAERFSTYFPSSRESTRYARLDYGPVTLITLDVTNGSPSDSAGDTNFMLLGAQDESGGSSPGFALGSEQYAWLEEQLADARIRSAFTFVLFHHVPYSVGPHGWPAGKGDGLDDQSGVPVRELTPLFLSYGVDAVIAGHDEMWERSEIEGKQVQADGSEVPHILHIYDVGIGGDGLRGPEQGLENPQQKFLVHTDAPEVWVDGILVSGGKHYGHLEVDVQETEMGGWQAVLKPVHVFPLLNRAGELSSFERRLYDDTVTLHSD
jgi:3',5'-cyclic AMP phosphodiesterase CpdA